MINFWDGIDSTDKYHDGDEYYEQYLIISTLRNWNIKYRKGEPSVTDSFYDSKYELAKELYPDDDFFKEVGVKIGDKERERKLSITMASMNKIKGMDELKDWYRLKNIPLDTQLILTPKFDGLSLCVNEKSKQATTRGDGDFGQSADEHYKYIKNHLDASIFEFTYGEIMMQKNVFNEIYAPRGFANPRNLVAGMINNKLATEQLRDTEYIKYGGIPYKEYKSALLTKHSILDTLNNFQKIKVDYELSKYSDLSEEKFVNLFRKWSEIYEIDGIIIEIDSLELQNKLGRERSTNNPVWARAYKSPAFEQSAETEVLGISWNISKQGYLKPILHVKPVKLDGVTVSNVTGNNAKFVRDNGIGVGSIVKIVRSGMVIPKVVGITKKVDFVMPDIQNIEWNENGVELVTMFETKEQNFKKIVAFFEILGVENAGEGVLKQLWESGHQTIKDILNLKQTDFERFDGFGKRKAEIVYNAIQSKIKDIELSKLMHATGIFNGLGSKKLILLEEFKTKPTIDQILEIEGFAEKSAQVYIDGYDKFFEFIKELPVTIKKTEKSSNSGELEGKVYVFTGVRDKTAETLIESKGGKISSGVNGKTTHLIMKEKGSGSSKENKAIDLGVSILTLEELWGELNG